MPASAVAVSKRGSPMYAPGFFTGSLIRRFGVLNVILAGVALVALCVVIALNGITVTHFLLALVLLGVGWNFMAGD